MQLGLVTYNLAKDWDLPTLIERCEKTGFEGVELRTTHAHGVEPTLDPAARAAVRERFDRTNVKLLSLGTTCEFHSADPEVVRRNVETCHEFARLAHDIGATGIKVRPNGFPPDVPREKTLEQIGRALAECGEQAMGYGVQIWLEVHGHGTQEVPHVRTILDHADHENVYITWNCNQTDKDDSGSIRENFELVADKIGCVHIVDLFREDYPWREMFGLLRGIGYQGYTLAELPYSTPDGEMVMRYYHALWRELQRA